MKKITIDSKHCSRTEFTELVQYLKRRHWSFIYENEQHPTEDKTYPLRELSEAYYPLVEGEPNFSVTGSVKGMKEKYYGNSALLVRCGDYIYNVTHLRFIYFDWAEEI